MFGLNNKTLVSHICVYLEWFWDCKLSTQYNILRKTLFSIESELFFVPFSYLCAATPILSKLRYPKNDDDKIANASTNGWWRRRGPRNLRQTINHPLDTTLPRDNVTMVVSYLCGFLFIVKDHKVKIEFEFWKKKAYFLLVGIEWISPHCHLNCINMSFSFIKKRFKYHYACLMLSFWSITSGPKCMMHSLS